MLFRSLSLCDLLSRCRSDFDCEILLMFIGIGTVINIAAILVGSALGVLLGNRFSEERRSLITDVLGLITLVSGASSIVSLWSSDVTEAFPRGWPFLIVLFSLLIGALIGNTAQIEKRLENSGAWLQKKLGGSSSTTFVQGFMAASLVFAIGDRKSTRLNSSH